MALGCPLPLLLRGQRSTPDNILTTVDCPAATHQGALGDRSDRIKEGQRPEKRVARTFEGRTFRRRTTRFSSSVLGKIESALLVDNVGRPKSDKPVASFDVDRELARAHWETDSGNRPIPDLGSPLFMGVARSTYCYHRHANLNKNKSHRGQPSITRE